MIFSKNRLHLPGNLLPQTSSSLTLTIFLQLPPQLQHLYQNNINLIYSLWKNISRIIMIAKSQSVRAPSLLSIPLPCKMAHLFKSCIILHMVLCMLTTTLNNDTISSPVFYSAPNLDKQYPYDHDQSILLPEKNSTHLIRLACLMTY